MKASPHLTVKDLVVAVQDVAASDKEVVAIVAHMFRTRRVALRGIRAAARFAATMAK